MSNVMSLKSFMNHPKRNGFDLSFKNAFTAKAGELLPVFCKEVLPGDKFDIKGQAFTRTQPVMSAAFVRMREYYDFFFVPYKLLWNRMPTFFTQLPDFHHASDINGSGRIGDQHPYFTARDLNTYFNSVLGLDRLKNNFFGYSRTDLSYKLLDFLGYGNLSWASQTIRQDTVLNPFPLLAYQKVCQDYFRDDQWEKAAPYRYNLDYITGDSDLHIPVDAIDAKQLTMFDLNYCNYPKDYFMGMLPSSQYGDEASVGFLTSLNVDNPFYLRELNIFDPAFRMEHNATSSDNPPISAGLTSGTDTFKAVINSDVSSSPSVIQEISSNSSNSYIKFGASSDLSGSSSLSVLALRQAEALQKWKEIAQSGRQDYQTQMQKHFGVTPSDAMSDHCRYLGGWTSNIDINEVVNTNLDTDVSQADIKGKGVSSLNGQSIDCEFKEHGIIIGMYHCLPLLDYGIDGIRKFNLKTHATDYAIPEFDSVGMEQLQSVELVNQLSIPPYTVPLGWVPRYADYKTSIDEIHGAFNGSLIYWVSPFTTKYLNNYLNDVHTVYGSIEITYEFFKVNPSILDNLFGVNADSSTVTDQFLVNAFFDVQAVRNLDYNGLPY